MLDLVFKGSNSQKPKEDEPLEMEESKGYGTTGRFEIANDGHNPYFIIAVTSNNCRTISPVYDYANLKVELAIQEEITRTTNEVNVDVEVETPPATDEEGNESGGSSGTGSGSGTGSVSGTGTGSGELVTETKRYKIGVKVKGEYYYFDNYPYDAKVSIKFNSGMIGGDVRFDPTTSKGDYAFFEITQTQYNDIKKLIGIPIFGDNIIIKNSEVLLTDYVKLKHLCSISGIEDLGTVIIEEGKTSTENEMETPNDVSF